MLRLWTGGTECLSEEFQLGQGRPAASTDSWGRVESALRTAMLSHGVRRWGACFVFSTPSIDLAKEGVRASWKLGKRGTDGQNMPTMCESCPLYIPRCPSFVWVSGADTQDFGGRLVNVLTSCITRDFRAHLSSKTGKSDRHWTNQAIASRMVKSARLDRRRFSPGLEASFPRTEIPNAELRRAFILLIRLSAELIGALREPILCTSKNLLNLVLL